jgi:hypothetical protein
MVFGIVCMSAVLIFGGGAALGFGKFHQTIKWNESHAREDQRSYGSSIATGIISSVLTIAALIGVVATGIKLFEKLTF